jgi:peptide/nickel transport system permease protein
MLWHLTRRMVIGFGLILAVASLTFLLLSLAPGDPARFWVGPGAGESELAAARHALGLDRPLVERYGTWLGQFVRGHWGVSLSQQRSVAAVIADALPHTLLLTGLSLLATYLGGIILGLIQAVKQRSTLDAGVTVATLFLLGMPSYWLAIMLVLIFAYGAARFGWPAWLHFPALGVASANAQLLSTTGRFADRLRHLALPLATLSLIGIAGTSRYVRSAILEVGDREFVRTAHAKGLAPLRVLLRHVLRNALMPVITLLGLSLPMLFSGAVFVEAIFAWPGMGRIMVDAVSARDYPVVMATTAIFGALVVAGNSVADILYAVADPRLKGTGP